MGNRNVFVVCCYERRSLQRKNCCVGMLTADKENIMLSVLESAWRLNDSSR